jgi:hypothetical protein
MTPRTTKSSTSVNARRVMIRDRFIIDTPRPNYHRRRWHSSAELAHLGGTTMWSAPAERSADGAFALRAYQARFRSNPKRGRASLAPAVHKAMAWGAVVPARYAPCRIGERVCSGLRLRG